MARGSWHILREDGVFTLARRMPPRFDVAATTRLSGGSRNILAQQIRQDLWRALKALKGFSPVVCIERTDCGLFVRAGGQVFGRSFPKGKTESRIAALLSDPENRARWVRHACRKGDKIG